MAGVFDGMLSGGVTDYYGLLGCVPSSSAEQIAAEYRRRALLLHPDKHPGDAEEASFRALTEAYHVLRDPVERAKYDAYRASGLLVSYAVWRTAVRDGHASVHWDTTPSSDARSITYGDSSSHQPQQQQQRTIVIESPRSFGDTQSELYRKFRNYEL